MAISCCPLFIKALFPHRVEELTHRELASKRCDVQCPVTCCKIIYHNEWFRCSVSDAEEVLNAWRLLMDEHSLYDRTTRRFRQDCMTWWRPQLIERAVLLPASC